MESSHAAYIITEAVKSHESIAAIQDNREKIIGARKNKKWDLLS